MAGETSRSLKLTTEQQVSADTALSKFGSKADLAAKLGMSRTTINKFFKGEPVQRKNFHAICKKLKFDWQPESPKPSQNDVLDIDELVREVRTHIQPIIQERCGTMRVLDMTQPIGLDKIYTHVNILEKITGRNRRELSELLLEVSPEKFERVSLGDVKKERVPGLEAVEKHSKLMILGKPGAGKTTFLKHLAMQCIGGKFQANHVPIFITLKAFAETEGQPDLLTYIDTLVHPTSSPNVQSILENGRALILLDGLDEVREIDAKRVLRQIQEFSERNARNAFVITCRIAAREYTFEQFTEVEVADFDDAQIADVSGKWFGCKQDEVKAKRFLEKLKQNPPIRELASSPLLLTLLCLVFEDSGEFPTFRWKIYRNTFKTLLKRRSQIADTVDEPFYKALSSNAREKLFRQMAFLTFEKGNYFFDLDVAERLLKQIVPTCLSKKNADLDIDDLESDRFLAAIESQHGILIERSHEVYSFSHLSFHEYFTAREIVETVNFSSLEKLATHITEKRWREVFLLTTGMLQPADDLLHLMKWQIDQLLAGDEKLQQFLNWVDDKFLSSYEEPTTQKTQILSKPKPCLIRSLYLGHLLESFQDIELIESFNQSQEADKNWFSFMELISESLEQDSFDYAELALATNPGLAEIPINEFPFNYEEFLKLGYISDFQIKLSRLMERAKNPDMNLSKYSRSQNYQELLTKVNNLVSGLHKKYQGFQQEFESLKIEYQRFRHEWQSVYEKRSILRQYYDANKLLVDCLNSDCYISRSVREEIEAALLLPIAKIMQRQSLEKQ